jgi:hypothetical protein
LHFTKAFFLNLTTLPDALIQALASAQLNQLATLQLNQIVAAQLPLAAEIQLEHEAARTTVLTAAAALLAAKPDPRAWNALEHYTVIKATLPHAPLAMQPPALPAPSQTLQPKSARAGRLDLDLLNERLRALYHPEATRAAATHAAGRDDIPF